MTEQLIDMMFLGVMNSNDRELSLPLNAWAERNLLRRRIASALASIRETHAIVPRKLIDDLADANSGGEWGDACDAITAWARDRAGEVKE